MRTQQTLTAITLSALVLLVAIAAFSIPLVAAQPRPNVTPRDGGGGAGAAQTQAAAAQATVQAQATNARATAQAGAGAAQTQAATLQARATQLPMTVDAIQARTTQFPQTATAIVATAQAIGTKASQGIDNVQATATALVATLTAYGISEATIEEWIAYYTENSSITYDPDTKTFTIQTVAQEDTIEALLNITLTASGYTYTSAQVDFTSGGVTITLEGITVTVGQRDVTGTLVLAYRVYASNGELVIVLTSATLNGQDLPTDQVESGLQSAVQLAINAALSEVALNAPATDSSISYSYRVTDVQITDNALFITLAVTIN